MSKISLVGLSALSLRFMAADRTAAAAAVYFLAAVRGMVTILKCLRRCTARRDVCKDILWSIPDKGAHLNCLTVPRKINGVLQFRFFLYENFTSICFLFVLVLNLKKKQKRSEIFKVNQIRLLQK